MGLGQKNVTMVYFEIFDEITWQEHLFQKKLLAILIWRNLIVESESKSE